MLRTPEDPDLFAALVAQVSDYAIIALDPQGVVETWNLGAQRLKGYTADEALGMGFESFYTPEDREAGVPASLLAAARRDGRVQHAGWRVRRDGTRFWGDVVLTCLRDASGRVTGYAKVTRDRTDFKRLEEAQDAFYAAFLHDFRTPLTSLKGFVEALRDAREDERGPIVDRIESSADRLLAMVQELVAVATTRAAAADVPLAPLDVTEVVQRAVRDLPPELRPGRVVVGDGAAPAVANADALHRVVTNLVVNALKYSEPGTTVHVEVEAVEDDELVRLRVRDRGRGIDPRDLDTIFDELERGRLAQSDGGTGLGLSSVRQLVERLHGTVELASVVGEGTTATVTLPAGPTGQSSAGRSPAPTGQPSG
ncbi:PAS domain S-box-containing protein [Nocardioides scoriae]|uniref:histidine kinase n=1 Tax=Nocardioides scoriae TaxID=642780 RepID=A0A1H1NDQ7_9ACTN|nr:PAS domain-containing sensor histidine kinase [Nocardioides scoriae]SDR97092.1 PAS domain S-box-containing protein [Nocardioides scoriae]